MDKILLVEDEAGIRSFVVPYLVQAGFEVDESDDGTRGLEMAMSGKYALIILDVMLPGMDGYSICAEIRKTSRVPVLMLTARSEEGDIVSGFEAGADDYLAKPFSPRELTARIKALMARSYPKKSDKVRLGAVVIDTDACEVFCDSRQLALTPKEFDLLLLLVQNPNRIFSREELFETVWGYDAMGDSRTVDTHVKQLREKLGVHRQIIATVWGKGYKCEDVTA